MRRPRLVRALSALTITATLTLTGCADNGDADDGGGDAGGGESPTSTETAGQESGVNEDELQGTTYVSTSVQGRELVDGTEITLSFEDDGMSVAAGCNTMFGSYEVDESGMLRWSAGPASTLMACSDELEDQDRWLTTLLSDGVTATSEGPALTLTAGEVVIELESDAPASLDTLFGRTWTLVGLINDGASARLPRGISRPFLSVREDGLARLNTGCNAGRTTVRIDGDQLVFGHAAITRRACTGPTRAVEQAMLAIVDQGRTDMVEVHDRVLLMTIDSNGLIFELDRG